MKKIILLRHAKTEAFSYENDDFDRKLTDRGHTDCKLICSSLVAKGIKPNAIISSPARRAKETAKNFANYFDIPIENIDFQRAIYDGITTNELIQMISQLPENVSTTLFVGHNPDIARFAYRLCEKFNSYVPTCCAIVLDSDVNEWAKLPAATFSLYGIFIPKNYK